jgi:hypothetical protein
MFGPLEGTLSTAFAAFREKVKGIVEGGDRRRRVAGTKFMAGPPC